MNLIDPQTAPDRGRAPAIGIQAAPINALNAARDVFEEEGPQE